MEVGPVIDMGNHDKMMFWHVFFGQNNHSGSIYSFWMVIGKVAVIVILLRHTDTIYKYLTIWT